MFAGALANRGRGRGGRGGAPAMANRFPQAFGVNQLSDTKPPTLPLEERDEQKF